jgi:hypothetical protein
MPTSSNAHLNTDNFDRLVPCSKRTTHRRSENLFEGTQLFILTLTADFADCGLGQAGETHAVRSQSPLSACGHFCFSLGKTNTPGTPVSALPDGDSVDTLVYTRKTLTAVDVHEDSKRRWGLGASGGDLMSRNLNSFHASRETYMNGMRLIREVHVNNVMKNSPIVAYA